MATVADWLTKFKAAYPGLWATLTPNQQDRIKGSMNTQLGSGASYASWSNTFEAQPLYTQYQTTQTGGGTTTPPPTDTGGTPTPNANGTGGGTDAELTALLESTYPTYWGSLSDTQKTAVLTRLHSTSEGVTYTPDSLVAAVSTSPEYTTWAARYGEGTSATPPPPVLPGTGTGGTTTPPPTPGDSNLLAQINSLLTQWGLPASLSGFIQNEITASKGYDEIINDLRATPEYQAAFPENKLRIANGLSAMSEQQILEYRDQAKQIASSMLGISVTNTEITGLIAGNKSLSEWASNLQTYASFERWGPAVKQALSQELGYDVTDERAFAFMSPDIPTPELDAAYTKALLRGQPAVLGFGIRPEAEAQILLQHGIDPAQAFAGYQGIAAELPRDQRLQMIDAAINGTNTPDAQTAIKDASFNQLFKAIQLRDPGSINELSQMIARETARWQSGGGVATSGTQAVGLLTSADRATG
jgi:hypothetical protein